MNEPSTRQHVTMDNIESVLVYLWWHAELHRARFGGRVYVFVRQAAGHHILVKSSYLSNWVPITT